MNMYNPSGNMYGQPVSGNHSDRMEIAAMTLGIISIVSCTCLYLAIPCGALAIILASLSRGGQMRYGAKAQVGLILGILSYVVMKVCTGKFKELNPTLIILSIIFILSFIFK